MKSFCRYRFGLLSLSVCFLVGCSTGAPSTQMLTVSASPDHARIYINHMLAGEGRVREEVRPKDGADVKIVAPGYVTHEEHVHGTLSDAGTADVLVGAACCLFAYAGLLSDGAMELTRDEIHVDLIPAEGPGGANPDSEPATETTP